ncbi:MAG TPA: hypothetical protein VMV94_21290 [Phycisphaerae bacterium]|nr:hypothetical protein [Phycisphaerae bacterium]
MMKKTSIARTFSRFPLSKSATVTLAALAVSFSTACQPTARIQPADEREQRAQIQPAVERGRPATPGSEPSGQLLATADQAVPCLTDQWIAELLAEAQDEEPTPLPPQNFEGLQDLSERDIALFIDTGPAVIPELMKHVHDHRLTTRYLHYPLHTGVYSERKMVGEVACYLIEAVLRQNPYFSTTGKLLYACPACANYPEMRRHALDQAASAYLEWYSVHPDLATKGFFSPPDTLPVVNWEYDWQAWPRLERATTQPWLELRSGS